MINIQNNISSLFLSEIQKNGFLLFLLTTTIIFAQNEKPLAKENDSIAKISTTAKNHLRAGNVLYKQGNYVAAESEYKEAIALNPNYDKANFNYGNTQFHQNKIKEASEQYELTSKITRNKFIKADSEHNLGNIAMKDKKYGLAVKAYKESLRNNPNDDETRYNLALAQKLLKEQQKKDDKKDKDKKDKDKKDDKKKDKKDKDKKDKDKKDDKKDDKKKDKKDDKKDEDKKDDKGEKDKDKKDKGEKDKKEQQPKPQQSKLAPEQVKQLLEAMNKEENKTRKKINAQKARGKKVKQDKDW